MKIKDVMSSDVQVAMQSDTIALVATRMGDGDFGFMPIVDGDKLVGAITDRDLTVRALAKGASANNSVSAFLTPNPVTVYADDDLKTAMDRMAVARIRRLPVVDRDNRLVGVVSLGDLSTKVKESYSGQVLESISKP